MISLSSIAKATYESCEFLLVHWDEFALIILGLERPLEHGDQRLPEFRLRLAILENLSRCNSELRSNHHSLFTFLFKTAILPAFHYHWLHSLDESRCLFIFVIGDAREVTYVG